MHPGLVYAPQGPRDQLKACESERRSWSGPQQVCGTPAVEPPDAVLQPDGPARHEEKERQGQCFPVPDSGRDS